MKSTILSFIISILSLPLAAQNWTKETVRTFKKEKAVALVINLDDATVMDVPIKEYPEYYSGKFSSNEKHANLVIERFVNRFKNGFYKNTKKESVPVEEARFTVVYDFREITDEGGFSGTYYVMDGENKSEVMMFNQKNGRWNDFETLLMENVDKFWKYKDYSGGANTFDGVYLKEKKL